MSQQYQSESGQVNNELLTGSQYQSESGAVINETQPAGPSLKVNQAVNRAANY